MKQVTINIPEKKFSFFMTLMKSLDFVKVVEPAQTLEDQLTTEQKEKKKRKLSESEDEDDGEVSEEEDDNGDIVRTDDIIQLDDDFDDTYAEIPEDYEETDCEVAMMEQEILVKEEEEDEWGF